MDNDLRTRRDHHGAVTTNHDSGPGRSLAYLAGVPIDRVKSIGPGRAKKFTEGGISSVAQFLLHVPRRYLDRSQLFDLSACPSARRSPSAVWFRASLAEGSLGAAR